MKTIEEILQGFEEEKRNQIIRIVDYCAKSIECETVNWKDFQVYDGSVENVQKILKKEQIQFLLPIISKGQISKNREIIIFCTFCEKDDEVWCVNVDATYIHAVISLSKGSAKMLYEK